MNEFLTHLCVFACVMFLAMNGKTTQAQDASQAQALTPERMEYLKDKADRFYQAGRMAEAYAIFNGPLAQNGDAYSQYMTGLMLFQGQGTPLNQTLGAAWMLVAANAGNGLLFEAADTAFDSLDRGQRRDAHKALERLNKEYGRCALKRRLIDQLQNLAREPSQREAMDTTRVTAVYGLDALDAPRELNRARAREHKKIISKACVIGGGT